MKYDLEHNRYEVSFSMNEHMDTYEKAAKQLKDFDRGLEFGNIADTQFHECGGSEDVSILHAEYGIWQVHDIFGAMESGKPGPVDVLGYHGSLRFETSRPLSEEEQEILKDTADQMNEKLCPDLFRSDSFETGPSNDDRPFYREQWTPEAAEFSDAVEAIFEDARSLGQ